VEEREPTLDRLPRGMRAAIEEVLDPGEEILAVWSTRGYGANALVCAPSRALISKRTDLVRWSVAVFPYSEIATVEVLDGRPGATQVELASRQRGDAPKPRPFEDFPDSYYQESRRLVASNTVMFRNRRRAREAVEVLNGLIAEHGRG
jgi:hypothetical protein